MKSSASELGLTDIKESLVIHEENSIEINI